MENPSAILLTFKATPAAGAAPGKTRFSGVAYSGGIVPNYLWHGDVAIDLADLRNAPGEEVPVLADHAHGIDSIAGKGRIFKTTGVDGLTQLVIEGELTEVTEAGRTVAALLADGYPLQMSVGMAANLRETTEPITVNGRTLKPAAVFEKPLIREVSFVPVGADPQTEVSAFANRPASLALGSPKEPTPMPTTPTAELDAVRAELAAAQATIATLQAQIAATAAAQRKADLAALFADIGRELPAEQADQDKYLSMPADAFAVLSAELKSMAAQARKVDRALFAPSQAIAHASAKPAAEQGNGAALMRAVAALCGKAATHTV